MARNFIGLSEKRKLQLVKELVAKFPVDIAREIQEYALSKGARAEVARLILANDPAAFVAYFPLFDIPDADLHAAYLGRAHLPPEAFNKYHLTIQEASLDTTQPSISPREIVVAGEVLSDGVGDFFNIRAIATSLQDRYPGQKVRVVITITKDHYERYATLLTLPPSLSYEIEFCDPSEPGDASIYPRQCLFPTTAKHVAEAAYTIQLAPWYGGRSPIQANLTLREPGAEGKLGLSEGDFGLLIPHIAPSSTREVSPTDLLHPWLKERLSASSSADLGMLYLNFEVKNASSFQVFSIMCALNSHPKERDLTLVCNKVPDSDLLLRECRKNGISEVVIDIEGEAPKTYTLSTEEPKRRLRLLKPGYLPHGDMLTLQSLSTIPFMGCTGDQSFSELIAINKVMPLYQIRRHKQELFQQYQKAATRLLGDTHPYVKYINFCATLDSIDSPPFDSKTLQFVGNLLIDPLCLEGAQRLHEWIKTERNASLAIPEWVAEHIAH